MPLANIKNSIKNIEMLEKSTGAMRIIAISAHTILKKEILEYQNLLNEIIEVKENLQIKHINPNKKILYVVIGSQRGLCGSYNYEIERYFKKKFLSEKESDNNYFFIIGKKLSNYILKYLSKNVIVFQNFKKNFFDELIGLILKYSSSNNIYKIIFIYTKSYSLFNKKIIEEEFDLKNENFSEIINHINNDKYYPDINSFNNYYLNIIFQYNLKIIFFHSLISEQASRFIAMDAANQNAIKQKNSMLIFYNKERQSKINNELLGLSSLYLK